MCSSVHQMLQSDVIKFNEYLYYIVLWNQPRHMHHTIFQWEYAIDVRVPLHRINNVVIGPWIVFLYSTLAERNALVVSFHVCKYSFSLAHATNTKSQTLCIYSRNKERWSAWVHESFDWLWLWCWYFTTKVFTSNTHTTAFPICTKINWYRAT